MKIRGLFDYSVDDCQIDEIVDCNLPNGWKEIGIKMLEEIAEVCDENFCIVQLKEKYGSIRLYAEGENEEVQKIIDKYEGISEKTCVRCGNDATVRNMYGWIQPLCDDCFGGQDG